MNNRYLYKAKRTDTGEWAVGHYLQIGEKAYIICQADTDSDGETTDLYATEWYEVDPSTICQCTGIKEKILWENDVVRAPGEIIGVVRFGDYEKNYGFYIEWIYKGLRWRNDILYWKDKIEVIGNAFDNPELMEVEPCREES